MHINELIPSAILEQAIEDGLVARKVSPDGTKHLYCYTKQAQFRNEWNVATINARGLTTDATTGEILARPFPKFFNYGDSNAPEIDLDQRVWAEDKLDGSLAVLQPDGTMTSKGSFTSDVAIAATKLYQEKYAGKWEPAKGVTFCFEFTSPDHRIVLNYGAEPELTFIGAVDHEDGFVYNPGASPRAMDWPGPMAGTIGTRLTFREVLALPPRENAEGLVIHWDSNNLVKLKQEDYLAMHRIVTNTSAATIIQGMTKGFRKESVLDADPDGNPCEPRRISNRLLYTDISLRAIGGYIERLRRPYGDPKN